MIALDGEIIRLKSPRLTLMMEFKEKDTSGQTSGTSGAEQGEKGKELQVSGLIPFADPAALARLFELAQDKGDGNERRIYRIGCELAEAVKIYQVKFSGRIMAPEQEGLLAWRVTFTLREHLSVPEKRELRRLQPEAIIQGLTEATVPAGATTDGTPPQQRELGRVERYLKKVDDMLAGEQTDEA
ncbi:baseplate complex protein [Zobellella sp. An-6]|uniref:baseplate complex protein n=1 Tax=Zobellella sp. An-6 TaxID=3400218 RepID=UPI00404285E4